MSDYLFTTVDFAPGVNNVVCRTNHKEFYAVETFHTSPFYSSITPILASDLLYRVDLVQVYGIHGLKPLIDGVIMLNNHPLRRLRFVGRISEFLVRESESDKVVYFLHLDDSSGAEIIVKLSHSMLIGAGVRKDRLLNLVICVVGMGKQYNSQFELQCESIEILGGKITEQVKFWEEALAVRKQLQRNWVQVQQIDDDDDDEPIVVTATRRKPTNVLTDSNKIHEIENTIPLESSIYIQKQRFNRTSFPEKSVTEWTPLGLYSKPKLRFEQELALAMAKYIVKTSKSQITLNDLSENEDISMLLDAGAEKKFSSQSLSAIEPIYTIKIQLFESSRKTLEQMGLVVKNGDLCECQCLLSFYRCLSDKRDSKKQLRLNTLIAEIEKETKLKFTMSKKFFQVFVYWTVRRSKRGNWVYNQHTQEWRSKS